MHSNVQSSNNQYQKLIHWLEQEQPDVFVVQEVTDAWITALHPLNNQYPHQVIHPRTDNFGIALYSKYPLSHIQTHYWPPAELPSIEVTIHKQTNSFSLITTHPLPPISKAYHAARNQQIQAAILAANTQSLPTILIGDMNLTPWEPDYTALLTAKKNLLSNTRIGQGILPTWPTFFLPAAIAIDHCFISPEWETSQMVTGPDIGSDHLPIKVTLKLPNQL
ncbi:MAG: endonuclease/exonuclease/phosphatase family protein [Methylococcales bacterium]|nr:endonuclease/exonuclease/phosphatase family protein [Methylococcales bacterium]MBT7442509.1 endonuclease/exonuclease/phosphatase family protein [Methylococcales bacterium]